MRLELDKLDRMSEGERQSLSTADQAIGSRTRSRPPAGFTLIELLVVIAIIGILAGLFLPTLSRAQEKAHRLGCVNIHRQWALGILQYAGDHRDTLPREGVSTNGTTVLESWIDIVGEPLPGDPTQFTTDEAWFNAIPGQYLPGRQPASQYEAPATRASFYEGSSFFHCPTARFPSDARSPLSEVPYFSIAMNSQLIRKVNAPTIKLSSILNPSQTVLLLDNLLGPERKVHSGQADDDLGQSASWATRFSGFRHDNGGTLSFIDGHVEWYEGTRVVDTEGDFAGKASKYGPEIIWIPY